MYIVSIIQSIYLTIPNHSYIDTPFEDCVTTGNGFNQDNENKKCYQIFLLVYDYWYSLKFKELKN